MGRDPIIRANLVHNNTLTLDRIDENLLRPKTGKVK